MRQALESAAGSDFWIDWECGNEQWGRIIDARGVQALVCARVPLGFAQEDLDPARMTERVFWMKVCSMDQPLFEVDRRLLEEVFGRPLSDNVDYSRLSVNDLWWATVT